MLKVITAPAFEPVSLSEAKNHLKVDNDADDALITLYITAAREHCEDYLNMALPIATFEQSFDRFPVTHRARTHLGPVNRTEFELWRSPLIAVSQVTYRDNSGDDQTLAAGVYVVDNYRQPPVVALAENASWPVVSNEPGVIKVRFTAGFATAAAIPATAKIAILLMVADWYDNREDAYSSIPKTSQRVLDMLRVQTLWG